MGRVNKEWLQSIADRAKTGISQVESVLASRHIVPTPVLASPRRLMLVEIAFSGIKDGVSDDGPFEFSWNDLGHGLWAMLTDQNLRGKSSIMEIVRWLIRGRQPSNLQEDVRRWVHDARLRFLLDDVEHEVCAQTKVGVTGSLKRLSSSGGVPSTLAIFSSESEFEEVMADFFMRALAMESITNWRDSNNDDKLGQAITHGWVAFSGAMFIGTNYDVLLGDMPVETGLSGRLMQMFLGLPWVSTLAAAKSAQKAVQNAADQKLRQRALGQRTKQARVDTISAELATKRNDLSQIPSDKAVRDTLTVLNLEYSDKKRQERIMQERLEREIAASHQVDAAYQEARRDLQTHLDSMAAGAVFRILDPTCCPRCDHTIGEAKKKQEKITHCCSVCGESISTSEDAEVLKAELEARVKASKAAFDKTTVNHQETLSKLTTLDESIVKLQGQIDENTARLGSFERRQELLTAIAVLEGRLLEASFDPEPAEADGDNTEVVILNAIVAETEERVKSQRERLLKDVSDRLVQYAQRFGMHNLSDASLKGNANLSLVKGGVATSYSKVTEGEKLRLKVATILAMIEVAEQRGIGRHPGLLMIDSPASQEVSPDDLDQLVSGLQLISQELPHFQVFVAGLTSAAITEHVPAENRREASNSGFLW
ncbi:large ATP-binding protein [Geobacter sulfurreducens]|nr:large ATP-binding protein [Geobacter sulfurreducens]